MDPSDLTFTLVRTPEDVQNFTHWMFEHASRPIALDTETTGLEWWTPGFLRLVQYGAADGTGWAVPHEWWGRLNLWAVEYLNQHRTPVVMHNAKFDQHALASAGLPTIGWSHLHDTKVLHHLDDPLSSHSLKPISVGLFGEWAGWGQGLLREAMNKHGWTWATVPVDEPVYWGYGVIDTILTAKLFDHLTHGNHEDLYPHNAAYDREMSYQRIMYGAELRGIRLDTTYSRELRDSWNYDVNQLRHQLQELGIENPNSNAQVEEALREHGWEPSEYTETGQALLDKSVLTTLGDYPHVPLLIEYKQKLKWISTYLDPFVSSGGRVHPSINTMAAKTGRSSIQGPPLQTLPHTPDIRNAVIPEEGHSLYAIDYSGQEYRILASLSGDPAWLAEFNRGAGDPHQLVADTLAVDRSVAKTFNFAMVYGAGKQKLADTTGLTVNQVSKFLDVYNHRFPGIDRFKSTLEAEAYRNEFKSTTVGGRTVQAYEDQLYAITNYVIQGSGADVLKEAACQLDASGMSGYIVVPVHDELVFSFPEEDAETMAEEAARIMRNEEWFDVPLVTEVTGPMHRWGDAYQ